MNREAILVTTCAIDPVKSLVVGKLLRPAAPFIWRLFRVACRLLKRMYQLAPFYIKVLGVSLAAFNAMFAASWYIAYRSIVSTEHVPTPSMGLRFVMVNTQVIGHQLMRLFRLGYTFFGLRKISARDISWWESKWLQQRKQLRNLLVPNDRKINIFPCHSGHTHPRSAEFRSSANEFLIATVETAGYTPYVVSRSNRDRGDGCRYFYHAKDYHVPYQDDPVKPDHCFVFTDVDYYADMNKWLKHWKPILIYTLVPKKLTHRGDEFAYTVDSEGVLQYHVKGGAQYSHPLWHYCGDTVTTVDWYGAMCVFDIEQREVDGDEHHRLIWLLPKARIPFMGWTFDPNPEKWNVDLKRLTVNSGEIDYLWDPVTDELSIRGPGEQYSVEIDGEIAHSIKARLANKDTPIRTSDIERMLGASGYEKSKVRQAPLLLNCWGFDRMKPNVLTTGKFQTNFSALPKRGEIVTEDGKSVGRAVTNPIVTMPALFASKGYNADRSTIEGRVDKPRNNVDPPRKYYDYAREFVKLVVPDAVAGTGTPLDSAEVAESQNGKLQKARFKDVIHGMSSNVVNQLKAFIKTEPYAAPNDPRNITTMSPELTVNMSAFTLQIAKFFKTYKWYGIGMPPKKMIKRMRELAQLAADYGLVPSDFSRFDGTVSEFLQVRVLLQVILRWLREEHRAQYKHYHKEVFKQKGVTAEGIKYDPGFGTRSGSPLTSFNTILNAYICFSALRNMGYPPVEALEKLGIYGGDDGNTPNWQGEFRDALEKASKELGMKCESGIVRKGEPVPYCGRYFADPWSNDETFQDPQRTMSKLHLSGNCALTVEQAACNRAHGYLSTDSVTPIIGTYCTRVLDICGNLSFRSGTHEEQYKCSNSWPQRDREVILEAMAKVMGVTTDEIEEMDSQIRETTCLDQFPVVFDSFAPSKCTAIVDGEIHETGTHVSNRMLNREEQQQATQQATQDATRQQPTTSHRLVERTDPTSVRLPRNTSRPTDRVSLPKENSTRKRWTYCTTPSRAGRSQHRKSDRIPRDHVHPNSGYRCNGTLCGPRPSTR